MRREEEEQIPELLALEFAFRILLEGYWLQERHRNGEPVDRKDVLQVTEGILSAEGKLRPSFLEQYADGSKRWHKSAEHWLGLAAKMGFMEKGNGCWAVLPAFKEYAAYQHGFCSLLWAEWIKKRKGNVVATTLCPGDVIMVGDVEMTVASNMTVVRKSS